MFIFKIISESWFRNHVMWHCFGLPPYKHPSLALKSGLKPNVTQLCSAELGAFVSNTFSELRGWELHFHSLGKRLFLLNHRVKVELDQPLKYASHSSCPTSFIPRTMQTHSLPLWLPFYKWPHLNQFSQSQTFLQF